MSPLLHKLSAIVMIGMMAIGGAWSPRQTYALPAAAGTTPATRPVSGERCPWVMYVGGGGGGGGGGQEFLAPDSASESAILSRLRGHKDAITTAVYSPNGRLIATSDGNDARLWDAAAGNQLLVFSDARGVSSPQFSPDSRLIGASVNERATWLTSGRGQAIAKVWDAATGREKLSVPNGFIAGFSPDSKTVAVASDGAVPLYDIATGTRKRVLNNAAPPVAFSPDGKIVAAVVPSGEMFGAIEFQPALIALWDAATGTRLRELGAAVKVAGPNLILGEKGHASVKSLVFSADGKRLLSSGNDAAARLWDVATGTHLRCFNATGDPDAKPDRIPGCLLESCPESLLFKRENSLLVAARVGPHIDVWNASANRVETTIEIPFFAYQVFTQHMTLSPAAQRPGLLTWSSNSMSEAGRTALVWDLTSSKPVGLLRPPGWLTAAALSPDLNTATIAHRYNVFDKAKTAIRGTGEAWIWNLGHADVTLAAASGELLLQGLAAAAKKEPEAENLLRKAQALNPDPDFRIEPAKAQRAFAGTLVAMGHTLARAGNLDAATSKFEQALNLDPNLGIVPELQARQNYAEELKGQAELLAEIGKHEAALEVFRQARDLDPTLLIEPELDAGWAAAQALMAQGENLAETGDIEGAVARFQEAQLLDPVLAVTPEDRARRIFDIARARELVAEGKKQAEAGDLKKGAATYRQALALDPLRKLEPDGEARRDYANALVQQGSELAQSGNTKGATAKFKQALTIDPTVSIGSPAADPALHATRIYAYTFEDAGYRSAYGGDVQGAIAKFRQALAIDPTLEINPELQAKQTYAPVLNETGSALAEAGNLDSAIAAYQQALALDPALDIVPEKKARGIYALVLQGEGNNLAERGDLEGAAEAYERALAVDPALNIEPVQEAKNQYAGAIRSVANELARAGEIEGASARYSEALVLNPSLNIDPVTEAYRIRAGGLTSLPRGLIWRADELASRGSLDRAVELYREALTVDSTLDIDPEKNAREKFVSTLMQEAASLVSSGADDAAAIVYLARAMETGPVASMVTDQLKELCWWGSLLGKDSRFLTACDEIVARTPNDVTLRDRRAIARALAGDFAGAIADLQYALAHATPGGSADFTAWRENWIQLLRSGRDAASIFNPATLQEARQNTWR